MFQHRGPLKQVGFLSASNFQTGQRPFLVSHLCFALFVSRETTGRHGSLARIFLHRSAWLRWHPVQRGGCEDAPWKRFNLIGSGSRIEYWPFGLVQLRQSSWFPFQPSRRVDCGIVGLGFWFQRGTTSKLVGVHQSSYHSRAVMKYYEAKLPDGIMPMPMIIDGVVLHGLSTVGENNSFWL